jgi:hypothetical protein
MQHNSVPENSKCNAWKIRAQTYVTIFVWETGFAQLISIIFKELPASYATPQTHQITLAAQSCNHTVS